jgi:hypothetical protein
MSVLEERLAEYAHEAWSEWMIYLFEKSTKNEDGSVTIPKSLVERWIRQTTTRYHDLSDPEKELDRLEARRMIKVFADRLSEYYVNKYST